jgi:hypothetical protein
MYRALRQSARVTNDCGVMRLSVVSEAHPDERSDKNGDADGSRREPDTAIHPPSPRTRLPLEEMPL